MTNDLNESPTSVTYSVTSAKGYNALLTIRDSEFKELATKMAFVEEWLDKNGYKPQVKQSFGQKKEVEYAEGKCPKCGGRLIKKVSKGGKAFNKCENGKWNFQMQRNEGCDFIDWGDKPVSDPIMDATDYIA